MPALTAASGTYVPFTGVNNNPSDKLNFGPRAGFAFDLFSVRVRPFCVAATVFTTDASPMETRDMRWQATGSPLAQTVPNISVGTYNRAWRRTRCGRIVSASDAGRRAR